jgi:hypothetical protein
VLETIIQSLKIPDAHDERNIYPELSAPTILSLYGALSHWASYTVSNKRNHRTMVCLGYHLNLFVALPSVTS